MAMGLTETQARALVVIVAFHAKHGRCPTHRQFRQAMSLFSASRTTELYRALIERGALERRDGRICIAHPPIPSDWKSAGYKFIPASELRSNGVAA